MRSYTPPPLDQCLVLEIDGPGVHPETADVPAVLELASAFFQLVVANADEVGGIKLTNIQIQAKCLAIAALPDRLGVAKTCAQHAIIQIAGGEAPKGCGKYVERMRAAIIRLPTNHSVKVLAGPWRGSVVAEKLRPEEPISETISIRAIPIRIGGNRPAVRFHCESEDEFTLTATQQKAREIGPYLYREIDIEALVQRDADGAIVGGQLVSFEPLSESDPRPAWREWFRSVGGDDIDFDDRSELHQKVKRC